MEHMGTRNLPFYAGTAHAYGLTYEQAVQSITLSAARILGMDEFCGSLEKGKDATLFISEGDALDMRTNYLTHAFVQGRAIDLDNRQRELYRKYQAKYGAPILD
jgi:imidazolonepropionase-like amidohydrolase